MNPFWHKNTLKTCLKHLYMREYLALKILAKIPNKWGLNCPPTKTSRWDCLSVLAAGDRLPVHRQRSYFDHWGNLVDRPVDRPKTESKALGRSTEPCAWPTCTSLCTSVDRPVDRPGRPPGPGSQISGSEKHVKNISKNSMQTSKNPQK